MRLIIDADPLLFWEQMETRIDSNGYVRTMPEGKYVHILVAEAALGRTLPDGAVVHHVDHDRTNNSPRNLVVCQDQAYHMLLHARQRVLEAGGHPDRDKVCSACGELKPKDAFSTDPRLWDGRSHNCRDCTNARRRGKRYGSFGWKERMHQQARRAIKKGAASPCG